MIPRGTNTLSKGNWPEPVVIERGEGAVLWDVEGNQWLDWTASLGPVILGYNHPAVNQAVEEQLHRGMVFPTPHSLEAEVAERICGLCPGVEAVRLGKTGSDAVAAAVRAARIYTGRQLVLCDVGYHGWHDWFATLLPYSEGVLDAQKDWTWPWDGRLSFWLHEAAALVIEPDRYTPQQLEEIYDYCAYHGTVVIWDEVICGFRMAPGGAREAYGQWCDLSCYGKAIANGMPVSAVGGCWEFMRVFNEGFWSTTHGGELPSLAAAKATLDLIGDGQILTEINKRGAMMAESLGIDFSYGARLHVDLTTEQQQALMGAGILTLGDLFGMASHDEEMALWTVQNLQYVLRTEEP